jgi:hypothetical protein
VNQTPLHRIDFFRLFFFRFIIDLSVQGFILTGLTKIALKAAPKVVPTAIREVVIQQVLEPQKLSLPSRSCLSLDLDVQQRAHEFLMIADLVG